MKPGSVASSSATAAAVSLISSASSSDRTSIQVRLNAPGVLVLPAQTRAAVPNWNGTATAASAWAGTLGDVVISGSLLPYDRSYASIRTIVRLDSRDGDRDGQAAHPGPRLPARRAVRAGSPDDRAPGRGAEHEQGGGPRALRLEAGAAAGDA